MELLAPAGDLNRLKVAMDFGADAIYIGGQGFSLRSAADNFNFADMKLGVELAHNVGKKVYLAANIVPHQDDVQKYCEFLSKAVETNIDAVIVSDCGLFDISKNIAPNLDIHISTQAGITNSSSATFWHKLGAKRVVLARELSFSEIKNIRAQSPPELELEVFVHGSMCISYSGRCLLSNYMTNRDSNNGDCAQPCRWKYFLMEETRQGEYFPIFEDEKGTFICNSKDLCLIEHIDKLADCKIDSLKIEGRMKTEYYVASVVKTYRQALDQYSFDHENFKADPKWLNELKKISHREYTTGFFLGKLDSSAQNYQTSSYIRQYDLLGIVIDYDEKTKTASILQKNKFFKGDTVEFLPPDGKMFSQNIKFLSDSDGNQILTANLPHGIFKINADIPLKKNTMMRTKRAKV